VLKYDTRNPGAIAYSIHLHRVTVTKTNKIFRMPNSETRATKEVAEGTDRHRLMDDDADDTVSLSIVSTQTEEKVDILDNVNRSDTGRVQRHSMLSTGDAKESFTRAIGRLVVTFASPQKSRSMKKQKMQSPMSLMMILRLES
jgi:hypothetical protein